MSQPSLVRGADTPPLMETTIGEAFDAAVARWPGQEALVSVHQKARFTFAELGWRVDAIAVGFHAAGDGLHGLLAEEVFVDREADAGGARQQRAQNGLGAGSVGERGAGGDSELQDVGTDLERAFIQE